MFETSTKASTVTVWQNFSNLFIAIIQDFYEPGLITFIKS